MLSSKRAGLLQDLLAIIAGGLLPLSLSPFNFWPLALAVPAALYAVTIEASATRVLLRYYLFNVAMFGVGVSWIFVSVNVYGGASVLLAGFLVALIVLTYSLLCLPQAWVYANWLRGSAVFSVMAFCGLWVIQEWVRSWILTGFPWLYLGYGVMDTPLRAYAPVTGIFGLSLAVAVAGVSLWVALHRRNLFLVIPAMLIAVIALGLQQISFTNPLRNISVSLVQGNVDQHVKWYRSSREPILNLYRAATEDEWGRDLIIWPEAALTYFHDDATPVLDQLDEIAKRHNSTLVLGIPDQDADGGFQNTVISLGEGQGQYIKRRLVPFGEYVPLERLIRGLIKLFDLPMARNVSGPRDQIPLTAGELTLSTSICYEVVYPDLVRQTVTRPDLFVTVSNDTWFGTSIGPWQHLQMAQLRALENGRSLARATNNGVTALIDHNGELISSLPQFKPGVLRGDVEIRTGATPFRQFGSYPVLLLSVLMVLAPLVRRLRSH